VDGQRDKLVTVVGHQCITMTVDICVSEVGVRQRVARVSQRQRKLVDVVFGDDAFGDK